MGATHNYTLIEYFVRGGACMWPLLLCSVTGLAVILYKAWQLLRINGDVEGLLEGIDNCVRAGDRDGAVKLCEGVRGPAAALARAALARAGQPKDTVQEAVQTAGLHELASLEGLLPALQTAGYVAPLLGFLGTVTGMIKAFFAVSQAGLGDPAVVSAGIAEALITTATGLLIAVPVYTLYNYFVTRVGSYALQMERVSTHVVNLVAARQEAA